MEGDCRVVCTSRRRPSYERVAAENALRGYSKRAPVWLTTLMLAEAWHVDPEHVSTMKRGMYWAQRWSVYQEVKGHIQSGSRSPSSSASGAGEPEWKLLERQMQSGSA